MSSLVEDMARAAYWADVLDRNLGDPLDLSKVDPAEWWQTNAEMPLSGPAFVRRWSAIATAALSVLKDRLPADDRELVGRLQNRHRAQTKGFGVGYTIDSAEFDLKVADRIIVLSGAKS